MVEICVSVLLVAMMAAPIMSTALTSSLSSKKSDRRIAAAAAVRGVSEHLKAFVTADRALVRGSGTGPDGWSLPGDLSGLSALEAGRHELDPARWAPGLAASGGKISYEVRVRDTASGPEPTVTFTVSWNDQ